MKGVTEGVLATVIDFEILFKVSSRKVLSQPRSASQPRAARSGPWRIQSNSFDTRLFVLRIRLKMLF